jgi:4-hydroxy-tetrahydrodipicolinate synthase
MKRFLEVISDEARNKILVTNTMGGSTFDERVAAFKHAESIGVSQTLIALDSAKKTEDEIYSDAKALIDATNLGVVVYANPSRQFVHLHPSGLPMNVFDRLAALPNVIAVKLTQVINLAAAFQLAERIADRVHIGVVNLEAAPLFAKYNLQWSGQWAVDAVQSPEKQFAVEFLDLLGRHRMNEAMKVYWTMEPACTAFYELQAPTLKVGGHPWAHIKYYQWMTGGNGGLLRDLHQREDQVPSLDSSGRKRIRDVFTRIGVKTVDLPDEAFLVGNGAYSDGVRARDLVVMPHYKV